MNDAVGILILTSFVLLVVFLVIAIHTIAGFIARRKGRSFFGFFFLSILATPLIAIVIAIFIKPNQQKLEAKELKNGIKKKCNSCAEIIKMEALVCRYCGSKVLMSHYS